MLNSTLHQCPELETVRTVKNVRRGTYRLLSSKSNTFALAKSKTGSAGANRWVHEGNVSAPGVVHEYLTSLNRETGTSHDDDEND
jgi:hypothetical protein